jgi:hypothetical protein
MIATPGGTRTLHTLPEDAVSAASEHGLLSPGATESANVSLVEQGDQTVYRVDGEQTAHLFGIIPVSFSTTSFVSTDNGSVIGQQTSLLNRVLQLFSR